MQQKRNIVNTLVNQNIITKINFLEKCRHLLEPVKVRNKNLLYKQNIENSWSSTEMDLLHRGKVLFVENIGIPIRIIFRSCCNGNSSASSRSGIFAKPYFHKFPIKTYIRKDCINESFTYNQNKETSHLDIICIIVTYYTHNLLSKTSLKPCDKPHHRTRIRKQSLRHAYGAAVTAIATATLQNQQHIFLTYYPIQLLIIYTPYN